MARYSSCVVLIQCFLILSITTADTNIHKDKYLHSLINFLNSLPLRSYNYEDGFLLNVQQDIAKGDEVEAIIKASELNDHTSLKVLKCKAYFIETDDKVSIRDDYSCNEVLEENVTDKSEETDGSQDDLMQVTEPNFIQKAVKLENEVQPDNSVTSGEQFIAIPRVVPLAPCVGCASSVNVDTPGVSDLALIGLQHLDRHNPGYRHTLGSVLEVQRQVQVVNGVRFILTLNVNFNNCTENAYNCEEQKVCKIGILEKPWLKLPNGSKFRAVVSNNCTEEWLFYEHENLPTDPENKDKNETVQPTTEKVGEDNLKAVQDTGLQSQIPGQEKHLNENEIKALEKQIIPHNVFNHTGETFNIEHVGNVDPNEQAVKRIEEKSEAEKKPVEASSSNPESSTSSPISDGKKKAIEDLMNFFDFNGPSSEQVKYRVKRSIIKSGYHNKRQILGGEAEEDPDAEEYIILAEKSLNKYHQQLNSEERYKIHKIKKVTTQVVAGIMTRIDFDIKPITDAEGCDENYILHCHSEIWSIPWLEEEKITVNCSEGIPRCKRQTLAGGLQEQDVNKYEYKLLAEKSLLKYYQESGVENFHKIVKISKVTTQVVAGSMTRIDFDITPTNCLVKDLKGSAAEDTCAVQNSDVVFHCHSEIWSRPWLSVPEKEQITITCQEVTRPKRQTLPGGLQEQDVTKSEYKVLAEKSLLKYYQESGVENSHKIVKISKVTTQVVAGSMTRIDFDITPTNCLVKDLKGSAAEDTCAVQNSDVVFHCHSEIWSRPWLSVPEKEQITITCQEVTRPKRQTLPGGLQEQDVTKSEYKVLAEKSLLKYYQESGVENSHKIVKISKVTTQVVAGSMTRIDFDITPTNCLVKDLKGSAAEDTCAVQNSDVVFHCHSEIWSRPWLSVPEKEQITITCQEVTRPKRNTLVGGLQEQDINKKEYKVLAEKSLLKYYQESGVENSHKIVKISKVTTQVVAGSMTRIDFDITPTNCLVKDLKGSAAEDTCAVQNSDIVFQCHSEIWSRPWLSVPDKEQITITCQEVTRPKRQTLPGGQQEQDVTKSEYKVLAEKSLLKYYQESGVENSHKIVKISKVTTQVVAGSMTRIDFDITPTNCLVKDLKGSAADDTCAVQNSHVVFHCHSEIWSRLWLSVPEKEQITITCQEVTRPKRQTLAGGLQEQDITKSEYKILAEKSLLKFYKETSVENAYKIVDISKVTTQIVSGIATRIDFDIKPTVCLVRDLKGSSADDCSLQDSAVVLHCHSDIWAISEEVITITCRKMIRSKRALALGAPIEEDPTKSEFIKLAKRTMSKFYEKYGTTDLHKIIKINKVTTQPVSGTITRIDFDISPTTCSIKHVMEYSEEKCPLKVEPSQSKYHVLTCHSEIWNRPWLPGGEEITIRCADKSDESMAAQDPRDFYVTDRVKRHIDNMNKENLINSPDTKTGDREDVMFGPLDNFPEQAMIAREISAEVLKHIEKRYPYLYKQKVRKVSMLTKSKYYVVKFEVGYTNCSALTTRSDCELVDMGLKLSCTGHVQVTDHSVKVIEAYCDDEDHTTDIYQHLQVDHLFREFVATYKPDYANNRDELRNRYNIFRNNIKKMQEYNVLEKGTATYGVTRFSDMTYEEFSGKYLGLKPSLRDDNHIPMTEAEIPETDVRDKFDWRDQGAVTEVKNQGSCGSCWAFSVTGNIEGQWKLKTGELVSLSEQELVDCDTLDKGCNGGLPDNAYRAIEELGGLETETDYPYEGVNDKCAFNKSISKVQITGAVNISSDEVKMAKWLTKNGPISIGINANAMQFYVGGISHPWHMLCNPTNLDHGVLIVGYGVKDYPVFKKTLPYWTIKNSWGKSWGEQGYYRVYRGDGTCGVNKMASSSIV